MSRNPEIYDPANDPLAVPRNSTQVDHIIATVTNKDDQIDAICEARGWMTVDVEIRDILNAYLDGRVSINETVELLAAPIDASYTSADQGYLLWETESTARYQRPLCSTKEALEYCGDPVTTCEPDPARKPQVGLEGQLWGLYFNIIHASRKQDWTAGDGRLSALVELVQGLKARPNPPAPGNATPAFYNHWPVNVGGLWSELCMLGPSAAENLSVAPGHMMGFTDVETRAWENENAFFALLTATGTAEFLNYGVWAMRDALEGGIARQKQMRMTQEFKAKWIDVTLGVVVVWLEVAGEEMFARVRDQEETEEPEPLMENGMSVEWKSEPTAAQWEFWKRRLAKLSQDDARSEPARGYAMRALERMQDIEARFA